LETVRYQGSQFIASNVNPGGNIYQICGREKSRAGICRSGASFRSPKRRPIFATYLALTNDQVLTEEKHPEVAGFVHAIVGLEDYQSWRNLFEDCRTGQLRVNRL